MRNSELRVCDAFYTAGASPRLTVKVKHFIFTVLFLFNSAPWRRVDSRIDRRAGLSLWYAPHIIGYRRSLSLTCRQANFTFGIVENFSSHCEASRTVRCASLYSKSMINQINTKLLTEKLQFGYKIRGYQRIFSLNFKNILYYKYNYIFYLEKTVCR